MKKFLVDFGTTVLMALGMVMFLLIGQELEGAWGFWVRVAGLVAFLAGLDWRITSAIRADRESLADRLEASFARPQLFDR